MNTRIESPLESLFLLTNTTNFTSDISEPIFIPSFGVRVQVSPMTITEIEDITIKEMEVKIKIDGRELITNFSQFGMLDKKEFENRYRTTLSKPSIHVLDCEVSPMF